jgi:hypothetical protein
MDERRFQGCKTRPLPRRSCPAASPTKPSAKSAEPWDAGLHPEGRSSRGSPAVRHTLPLSANEFDDRPLSFVPSGSSRGDFITIAASFNQFWDDLRHFLKRLLFHREVLIKSRRCPQRPEPPVFCARFRTAGRRPFQGSRLIGTSLDVVIQLELIGMRPQAHRVHFLLPLIVDVRVQHLFGEHIPFQQELIVASQAIECAVQ